MEIQDHIEALETSQAKDRLWNRITLFFLACLALGGTIAWVSPADAPAVLRAHRFELVDAKGKVRGVLTTSEAHSSQLVLLTPDGAHALTLSADPQGSSVWLERDNDHAGLMLDSESGVILALHGKRENDVVASSNNGLQVLRNGKPLWHAP